jgi:hypothetical protein
MMDVDGLKVPGFHSVSLTRSHVLPTERVICIGFSMRLSYDGARHSEFAL